MCVFNMRVRALLLLCAVITGSVLSSPLNASNVVSALQGREAVLGCSFTHPKQKHNVDSIKVTWTARSPNVTPFFQCEGKNDTSTVPIDCLGLDRFSFNYDLRRGKFSLLIRGVEMKDDGVYFCHVALDKGQPQISEVTLEVQVKPSILSLSLVNGSSSGPQRLQCVAEGKPPPGITWLSASGVPLASALLAQVRDATAGLNRSSSVPYDEQLGELTCRAESVLGRVERTYPPAKGTASAALIWGGMAGGLLLLLVCGAAIHRLRLQDTAPLHSSHNAHVGTDEVQTVYADVVLPEARECHRWITGVKLKARGPEPARHIITQNRAKRFCTRL
ncbi:sialic acid binding Ig-like lectin 15, like isoform X2 [Syngnathoides biaculeatus]|uniref:sialic acid binding Ig-like lectin 15, like isoform X2 n=1 Tax=Syngnathoides biaculeatus TaxID=300417 RepID=UPI002ADE25BB|nr:sialic acid binding Ig-like lectin 15, like isoform X2 [Syngnathoides biaculeatus]